MASSEQSKTGGVLVVEDEALVRMLVVQTLQEAGFVVCEAAEAGAALEALRADDGIRLMVTDLGLPGVDGRRLADQARAHRPDMKVLFMTGHSDSVLLEPVLPNGFAMIAKPFDLDQLAAHAHALMEA